MKGRLHIWLIVGLVMFSAAMALKNPSAVYCESEGYEYVIENTELGEKGVCRFNDGTTVDAWELFRESGVSADELDLAESVCGDSVCYSLEENIDTCPADCQTGLTDSVCDPLPDRRCDADCLGAEDPDCPRAIMTDISNRGLIPAQGNGVQAVQVNPDMQAAEQSSAQQEKSKASYAAFFIIIGGVLLLIAFVLIVVKSRRDCKGCEQLKDYINRCQKQGLSKGQIEQNLQKIGWSKKDIERAFK